MANTARNGKLLIYSDGQNPGAGSAGVTVQAGGAGINANWETLDYLFDEHNTDGTHKDDKIGGAAIKNTIVDGSTLEATATSGTKTFRIKDGGVTTAKIANQAVTAEKLSFELGWQNIFGDARPAGTSAGNTPAAITEWSETSKTAVVKLSFFLPKLSTGETRVLRIRCNAKTDNASRAWNVQLNDSGGSVLATTSGVNTSYDATAFECGLSYTITDGANNINTEYQIAIYVAAGVGGTASIKNLCVYVTPS